MQARNDTIQLEAGRSLRHLLSLEGLPRALVERLLERAGALRDGSPVRAGGEGVLATLFHEPSTRTRLSFEIAAQRLGWGICDLDAERSSALKGESLADTVKTLGALGVAVVALRHTDPGAAARAAGVVPAGTAVVNAGGGASDHPTQGLGDALTIRREKGELATLRIAICGDVRHSRVARSDIQAFTALGARGIRLVGPPEFLPDEAPAACELVHDRDAGLAGADVVIGLRIQTERLESTPMPDAHKFHKRWGLTAAALRNAAEKCIVMHPGPMNRGIEIDDELADGPRSRILQQVRNGVYARMAVLEALAEAASREA